MKKVFLKVCDRWDLYPYFNQFTNKRGVVFMAHRFSKYGVGAEKSISTGMLEGFLHYLSMENYRVIGVNEYLCRLTNKGDLSKTVVFTVDDGYRDFYDNAFPVFRKYNFPATVFLTTDFIDHKRHLWWDIVSAIYDQNGSDGRQFIWEAFRELKKESCPNFEKKNNQNGGLCELLECLKKISEHEKNSFIKKIGDEVGHEIDQLIYRDAMPLSWDQVREMVASGVEFYPHTKTHPVLTKITSDQVFKEVEYSKARVEAEIGRESNVFCYPNGREGDFDEGTISILKHLGFLASFTAEEGFNVPGSKNQNFFKLNRYSLPPDFSRFKQIVSGLEAFRSRLPRFVCN